MLLVSACVRVTQRAFGYGLSLLWILGLAAVVLCGGVGDAWARTAETVTVTVTVTAEDASGIAFLVSPQRPVVGGEVRVLASSLGSGAIELVGCTGPSGKAVMRVASGGGPPHWALGRWEAAVAGQYTCQAKAASGAGSQEVSFEVAGKVAKVSTKASSGATWKALHSWTPSHEALYSAWLEVLFDAPEGTSWNGLHEVTGDAGRNLLHNHLGLAEDAAPKAGGLRMLPDCIENPYFLRAYFAWKLKLPFGFHRCKYRLGGRGPSCKEWLTHSQSSPGRTKVKSFQSLTGTVASVIHSGAGRTPLKETATDLYPVALERRALYPGTVYADPYGHTLMLSKWVPQTKSSSGLLLCVDAQPDGTIQIKRFWQGNFMFTTQVPGGPGFKQFRPVVGKGKSRKGRVPSEFRYMQNKELDGRNGFPAYSLQQASITPTQFFDTMDGLINPIPRDPEEVLKSLYEALIEQLKVRVQSVENGEQWKRQNGYPTISMPDGASIFQTGGPWEDFSTPSRDLRLLLALDALSDFDRRLERTPNAFIWPANKPREKLREELRSKAERLRKEMSFSYPNSQGESVTLTVAQVLERAKAFEMSYNPNDCPEVRWGAPEKSTEASTCRHKRPKAQTKKMEKYRVWFQERRRPAW